MTDVAIAPPRIELETEALLTGEQALALGDIGSYELIEGRIMDMSPTGFEHGDYELNFGEAIKGFVRRHKLGKVSGGEAGIYTRRNPDTVRGADVAYISHERYAQRKRTHGFLDVAPDLIVEIMSPDDRWSEVIQKLREYFAIGVRLVWVADPESRTVYAYRALTDLQEFGENDNLTAEGVLPGFSVPVAQLFED
ncbi:MAG: Uma2 family endonuclease [Chloroflexi bacterium]|nr:Uma2 family endonuclease [Chloroflexota bacterium]